MCSPPWEDSRFRDAQALSYDLSRHLSGERQHSQRARPLTVVELTAQSLNSHSELARESNQLIRFVAVKFCRKAQVSSCFHTQIQANRQEEKEEVEENVVKMLESRAKSNFWWSAASKRRRRNSATNQAASKRSLHLEQANQQPEQQEHSSGRQEKLVSKLNSIVRLDCDCQALQELDRNHARRMKTADEQRGPEVERQTCPMSTQTTAPLKIELKLSRDHQPSHGRSARITAKMNSPKPLPLASAASARLAIFLCLLAGAISLASSNNTPPTPQTIEGKFPVRV